MRKLIFLVSILTLSVFTTACINNLAVQELNNKAAEYMKKGDYENAISRLKSSADLDSSIFETQYNLAIAYTENSEYENAIKTFEKALELRPESKDTYYSMAVMYENYAKDVYSGETKAQMESLNENDDSDTKVIFENGYKPAAEDLEKVKSYYQNSINCYNKYIELSKNATDEAEVSAHIEDLNSRLESIGVED